MTWEDIPGWFDWPEVYTDVVTRFKGGILVEVGAYLGRSLCFLGEKVKRSGKPFRVVGVDWCLGSGVENGRTNHEEALQEGLGTLAGTLHRNVVDCGLESVIDILISDSTRAARLFPDASLTMVFLDAKHDHASVVADIRAWLPKIRPGGILAGDDVGTPDQADTDRIWPDVKRALDDTLPGWTYAPHDAWKYTVK